MQRVSHCNNRKQKQIASFAARARILKNALSSEAAVLLSRRRCSRSCDWPASAVASSQQCEQQRQQQRRLRKRAAADASFGRKKMSAYAAAAAVADDVERRAARGARARSRRGAPRVESFYSAITQRWRLDRAFTPTSERASERPLAVECSSASQCASSSLCRSRAQMSLRCCAPRANIGAVVAKQKGRERSLVICKRASAYARMRQENDDAHKQIKNSRMSKARKLSSRGARWPFRNAYG